MENYSHALVYFPCEKTVTIHEISDILGWSCETMKRLQERERVMLQVLENRKIKKVRILQAASSYDELVETAKFVTAMKAKGRKMDQILMKLQPVRDGTRQKLPPTANFFTETDDSEAPAEKVCRHEHSVMSSPSPSISNAEDYSFPAMRSVTYGVPEQTAPPKVVNSPQPPRVRQRTAIKRIYDEMMNNCRELNIDPESHQATLFFIAGLTHQSCEANARLKRVEEEVQSLKIRISSHNNCHSSYSFESGKFPIFSTRDEYLDVENLPVNLESWISVEGGDTLKHYVNRVLNKLLAPELQLAINRPGSHGKLAFHKRLENLISHNATKTFPGTTCAQVEKAIARFFNNARDRFGGRSDRRSNQATQRESNDAESNI